MKGKSDRTAGARRDRWIRWAIGFLLIGAVAAYAMTERVENLELEENLDVASMALRNSAVTILSLEATGRLDSVRISGLEANAQVDSANIVNLETQLVALESLPPQIDTFVVVDTFSAEIPCPVCLPRDTIFPLRVDTLRLPPIEIEIRVVEYRRRWWEYAIAAGLGGVVGFVIGDSDNPEQITICVSEDPEFCQ